MQQAQQNVASQTITVPEERTMKLELAQPSGASPFGGERAQDDVEELINMASQDQEVREPPLLLKIF